MATDFFGYNRDVKPNGQIASSEFATLSLGSRMALVQSVQATYSQSVNSKFEVGSPTLFWVTGQPQGNIQFSRLVGKGGFLSAFGELENACGKVIGVAIGLDGTGGCSAVTNAGGRGVQFSGGVPENINISFSAGTLEVSEGAALRVASMTLG
jgi:hypothetical protein